jgi:hypothetical protein
MKSFKQFIKEAAPRAPSKENKQADNTVSDFARGAYNSATMDLGKYARAGVDYTFKNIGAKLGVSQPTTYDKELKQEKEKDTIAQTRSPDAYKYGGYAADAAALATGVGGVVKGAAKLAARASVKSTPSIKKVYRVDDKPINDFNKNLGTYASKRDGSESGKFSNPSDIPKNWITQKGLYGTTNKPEAVGYVFPRGTKNTTVERPGKTTMVIDKKPLEGHTPTLSTFERTPDWKRTSGSEVFSKTPRKPTSQETITNPIQFAKEQGVKVIVGDPAKYAQRVQNVIDKKNIIQRLMAKRKVRITGEN